MDANIAPNALETLRHGIAVGLALLTLPGSGELLLLTVGAWLPGRRQRAAASASRSDLRLAAVVPAHDEEALIERCVRSLRACRAGNLRFDVVVIADNCSDATAERAANAGARVLVRTDPLRRGKGHALRFAFDRLLSEGYDGFVVVDADSVVAANFMESVGGRLAAGAQAVQVPYGVLNPDASARTRLMRLALWAFNRLRPRSRAGWGLSAGILGNGFALSRATLAAVPYDAESVVEDLEYHLRLVRSGRLVEYADDTEVLADMPAAAAAAGRQRARWEGGRWRMFLEHAPSLARDLGRGRWRVAEPLLDLLLPPLALHAALLGLCLLAGTGAARAYAAAALAGLALHVLVAVRSGGGSPRDLAVLAAAPLYVAWKLSMLPAILHAAGRRTPWLRTPRELAREGQA